VLGGRGRCTSVISPLLRCTLGDRIGSFATKKRCPRTSAFHLIATKSQTRRPRLIRCVPTLPESTSDAQEHECAQQRPNSIATLSHSWALRTPSGPWWTKPIDAHSLQGISWALRACRMLEPGESPPLESLPVARMRWSGPWCSLVSADCC